MKKTFTSICCLVAAMGLNAQNQFVISPAELDGAEVSLFGEAISDNQVYVVGEDQGSQNPMIWNTVTGDVIMLAESELLVDEYSGETYKENWTGYFLDVTDEGLAVGCFGAPSSVSHAILCDANDPEDYIVLYEEDEDTGSVAYGISDDGSTVVGFHFDASWTTYGCVWTEGGTVRTDLPWPTEEECGFTVDYASARGMSADGSVIMGYAQDNNYGAWVFICWYRQADGTYKVDASAANKYFEFDYGLGKPYMTFEPNNISKNGEWVTLRVVEEFDPFDWNYTPLTLAARLNLKTQELEVFPTECSMFGIANNGTAVGRVADENWLEEGIVWYPETSEIKTVKELFPEQEELTSSLTSGLSNITRSGNCVTGMFMTEVMVEDSEWPVYIQNAFIGEIPFTDGGEPTGIKNVEDNNGGAAAFDLMGRRVLNTKGHITVVNGKKSVAL